MINFIKTYLEVVATGVSVLVGVLTVLVILRRKQMAKPRFRLILGIPLKSKIRRKKEFRRFSLTSILFAEDGGPYPVPKILIVPYTLDNNGKEAIKDIRLQLEYNEAYAIDDAELPSILDIEPQVLPSKSCSKDRIVFQSQLGKDDIEKVKKHRTCYKFAGRAIVAYEVPLLRPGEILVIPDIIRMESRGVPDREQGRFEDSGFRHILERISDIEIVRDFFVVDVNVYSETCPRIKETVKVVRIDGASEQLVEEFLKRLSSALWLGNFPKPGIYFRDPITSWILRKFGFVGKMGREAYSYELAMLIVSRPFILKIGNRRMAVHDLQQAEIGLGSFVAPNCNYLELPLWVDSNEKLNQWLGLSRKPLIQYREGKASGHDA